MENTGGTFEIVRAGLQLSLRMSKQMAPELLILPVNAGVRSLSPQSKQFWFRTVINLRAERDLWWLERIVLGEVNIQEKNSTRIPTSPLAARFLVNTAGQKVAAIN